MNTKTMTKTLIALATTAALFSTNFATANKPVWDGNKVVMTSEKLDDGVFAYYPEGAAAMQKEGKPIATSGGIIVGDKGALIIDTMLNKRLNLQIQHLVKDNSKTPILYAVNTSAHGGFTFEAGIGVNFAFLNSSISAGNFIPVRFTFSNIEVEGTFKTNSSVSTIFR